MILRMFALLIAIIFFQPRLRASARAKRPTLVDLSPRDEPDGYSYVVRQLVLDPRVETLGALPDADEVHLTQRTHLVRERLHGPDVGVEIEVLADADGHAPRVPGVGSVVVGPLKQQSEESRIFHVSSGMKLGPLPVLSHHSAPASHWTNSAFTPLAFTTSIMASTSSAPVPSPRIRATFFMGAPSKPTRFILSAAMRVSGSQTGAGANESFPSRPRGPLAPGGPRSVHARTTATLSSLPWRSASTEPSALFRTQPATSWRSAWARIAALNETPCTVPFTRTLMVTKLTPGWDGRWFILSSSHGRSNRMMSDGRPQAVR